MSLEQRSVDRITIEFSASDQPSVIVKKSEPSDKGAAKPTPETKPKTVGEVEWGVADLAVLDLTSKKVTRLVERTPVRFYAFSPDEKSVAYVALKGWEANSQQPTYDLGLVELASGNRRTLATDVRLGYGIEWTWSPDGGSIAYIASGIVAPSDKGDRGAIVVVPVDGGPARTLKGEGVPSFDPGDGEIAPVFDAKGENFYAVGDGALWRVDAAKGKGEAVAKIPGWKIRSLVQPYGRATLLSPDGRTAWVLAREAGPDRGTEGPTTYWQDSGKAGFFAVDLITGKARPLLSENKSIRAVFNLDANPKTGEIVFSATDQQHLHDLWILDSKSGKARQVTRLNEQMERHELGQAKLIEWRSMTGELFPTSLFRHCAESRLPFTAAESRRDRSATWTI